MIRTVPVDCLSLAIEQVTADSHSSLASWRPTVSAVTALRDRCDVDMLVAVMCRLVALSSLVVGCDDSDWMIRIDGRAFTLPANAVIRAAAWAPLEETTTVHDLRFGPKFLHHVLSAAGLDGWD